jgi:superfamily II DNA or RNA helicase
VTESLNVIDNNKILLKDILLDTLPNVESADFALGYFFISGFNVIVEPVKKLKKLRLLISNTTNQQTAEALIEGFKTLRGIEEEHNEQQFPNNTKKELLKKDANENVIKSLELMEQTADDQNVVTQLIEMMKNKKVEVRIYSKEKLHAKAYLFDLTKQSQQMMGTKGIGIVGSSNLSMAGIQHSSELNLRTTHPADYDALKEWFEELWKEGLEYTEDFEIILQNSWAGKTRTPYEMYLKGIYHEIKDRYEGDHEIDRIWGSAFPKLYPFQNTAVKQALSMFELYGGMIIGDVVGLGKTFIGTALLKYLELQGYRPLIICPPHLMEMWEKFCSEYEVNAKILSRGKLSRDDFELFQDYKYRDRDLVLIDESHHFRNSDSRQYENLHTFMSARDAKGILLTATPFSNSAEDIKNQIMLFHSSPETTIPPAEGNLDKYFRKIKKGEADLVDLLRNIMIRRTRRFVLNQWGKKDDNGRQYLEVGKNEKLYFPNRKMVTTSYDIGKVYNKRYDSILEYISGDHLTFARYSPGVYLKPEYLNQKYYSELKTTGPKLVALMRHLLLKRMESCQQSFKKSIGNLINVHTVFINLLEKDILPIGDVSQKEMYETALNEPDFVDDEDKINEIAKKILDGGDFKYDVKAFDIELLKQHVRSDLDTLLRIEGLINRITNKTDDKLHQLQKFLDENSDKKILIFTEFSTTAEYLNQYITWKKEKRKVDSGTSNTLEILRRFDPINNKFDLDTDDESKIKKSDEISLLIATDVLSEGVNLQAGQIVINYDFHWNPTRLIQRAGRVDRIGSKHETIQIINFLPDPQIEEDLGLERVVGYKIDEIQRVIGEDAKILKETENINKEDVYAVYNGDEDILDKSEMNNPLEPSEFENIINDIQINNPKFWEEFKQIPDGVRSAEGDTKEGELLMACEAGSIKSGRIRKYYLVSLDEKIKTVSSNEALNKLRVEKDVKPSSFPKNYDELIKKGWKKFLDEYEQIQAKEITGAKKNQAQKWVNEFLMKLARNKEFDERIDEIQAVSDAFNTPFSIGQLNRELRKLQKSNFSEEEIFERLLKLAQSFDLKKVMEKDQNNTQPPRILYSEFIGN